MKTAVFPLTGSISCLVWNISTWKSVSDSPVFREVGRRAFCEYFLERESSCWSAGRGRRRSAETNVASSVCGGRRRRLLFGSGALTSLTFILLLADVSRKAQEFHWRARPTPDSLATTRSTSRSHLFPTRIMGTCGVAAEALKSPYV